MKIYEITDGEFNTKEQMETRLIKQKFSKKMSNKLSGIIDNRINENPDPGHYHLMRLLNSVSDSVGIDDFSEIVLKQDDRPSARR